MGLTSNLWKSSSLLSTESDEIHYSEQDDQDFASDIYVLAESTTDELLNSWKVFTALKDESYQGRRLENAAWRLHAMQKLGKSPSKEAESRITGREANSSSTESLAKASRSTEVQEPLPIMQATWSAAELLGACLKHKLSNETMDDVLQILHSRKFDSADLPRTSEELRALPLHAHPCRPVCAIFTHSLERNGANNFCLYIARVLKQSQPLTIFSPKPGPMKEDFEKLGLQVSIVDTASPSFLSDLAVSLKELKVGMLLANTIMRCDIILMAADLQLPSVWVIHESWPQDQLDHYAKEVFMCKDIDSKVIRKAFKAAGNIIFPSDMQRHLYDGMFQPEAGRTIYNGIPLQQLDHFKQTRDRREVRLALGYSDEDFVVLHLGTVCSRKGQMFSATACSKLIKEDGCTNLKQLIVGARYIRDHEIRYIDQIFQVAAAHGVSCRRWEDLPEEERGQPQITVMDIQAAVLQFYMAADVVLVPSLNEVLPLVICEAMAFERPVVCSRIDAIPEAVTDGVEGYLVPPGSPDAIRAAVLKLYRDPAICQRMGAAGRARVLRQFSYSRMGEHYRELLDTVTTQPARAMATLKEPSLGEMLKGRTVLVDMDNTIVDWDAEFIRRYASSGLNRDLQEVERIVRNRAKFEIEENFPESERTEVLKTLQSPGFYESLKPLPGAVEALRDLVEVWGVDVKLVTAPHPSCPGTCALEKYASVERIFGASFQDRLIITRDKTHVMGDILIDDKPHISGSKPCPWKHVIFSQSYNQNVQGKARLSSWNSWQDVLPRAI